MFEVTRRIFLSGVRFYAYAEKVKPRENVLLHGEKQAVSIVPSRIWYNHIIILIEL